MTNDAREDSFLCQENCMHSHLAASDNHGARLFDVKQNDGVGGLSRLVYVKKVCLVLGLRKSSSFSSPARVHQNCSREESQILPLSYRPSWRLNTPYSWLGGKRRRLFRSLRCCSFLLESKDFYIARTTRELLVPAAEMHAK